MGESNTNPDDVLVNTIKSVGDRVYDKSSLYEESQLSGQLQDWVEKHGLDKVENTNQLVCHLSVFDRLLKIALHSLYSIDRQELDNITTASDVTDGLNEAHEKVDDSAFERYVLDDLVESVDPSVLQPLLDNVHHLVNTDEPSDEIARIFEELIPNEARRKLGQFRTPRSVAEVMAEWAVRSGDDLVLDPGMGSGVLTSRMYGVKTEASEQETVEDIWGIDLSELAVVMTSTALKLVNGEGTPHLYGDDFIKTSPEGAQVRLDQADGKKFPVMDAVVSNPPYSRHHELSVEDKDWVNSVAEAESTLNISKRAPMYLYFYIHAAQFLEPGGRLSFVTPSEFLDTNYGASLKKFLAENFHIHGFMITGPDYSIFNNARTTSCISFLEKKKRGESSSCTTTFIELSDWPDTESILNSVNDGSTTIECGTVTTRPQKQLDPETNWTNYFNPAPTVSISNLKTFSDIADIKRGIATGKNEFFCLTESDVQERNLDKDNLARIVRRADQLGEYNCTTEDWQAWAENEETVWLLYDVEDSIDEIKDQSLISYLEYGEEIGANESYLAKNRNPWYRIDRRSPPDILATYMSKNGFRFVHNEANVRSLNNLHNVNLREEYTSSEIKALLAYLNSEVVDQLIGQTGRSYSEGMEKIEPGELKDIPVVDPKDLSSGQVSDLCTLFERLVAASRAPKYPPEEIMAEIEEYLSSILEITYTEGENSPDQY